MFEPLRRLINAINKPNSPQIRLLMMIAISCRALKYTS